MWCSFSSRPTVIPGRPILVCNPPCSHYHRLICSHTVTTPLPTPCGTNCSTISPHATSRPFSCAACHRDLYTLYPDLKYLQHCAALPANPTLPQFRDWFYEGLEVERRAVALLNAGSATHRASRPVARDGGVLDGGEYAPYHPSWVDWATSRIEIPVRREEGAAPELVTVDQGVWDGCGEAMRELVVRKEYNERAVRQNGAVALRRVEVMGVVSYVSEVDPELDESVAITEEEQRQLAAIEADLERDGVVSRITRLELQL